MATLALKHGHLMAERHDVDLRRRPGKKPPQQVPDNRPQNIKHRRRMAMSLSLLKFVGQASLVDDAMLPS